MTTNAAAPAATPVPGSPEHDAAMIALAERSGVRVTMSDTEGNVLASSKPGDPAPAAAPANEPAAEQRPEWIPEKFWTGSLAESAQKMAASYAELERARSQPKPAAPAPQPAAAPGTEGQPQGDAPATEQTPAINSLLERAASEYEANKTFTDETFEALEKAGIPRGMAQNYVAGLAAQAELVETKVYGAAGGQAQYTAMSEWAAANLSEAQLAAYNSAVTSGDLTATLGAVENLKALYTAANGADPQTRVERVGGSGNEPVAEMYRSKHEVMKDMNDPRYKAGDKAFHALVDRKLEAAMRAGIDVGF